MQRVAFLSCLALTFSLSPAVLLAQASNAARWVAAETLKTYCQGAGSFEPNGLIETDLTGDGRDDLLIYTGGLRCDGGLPACGAVYCDVNIYVREGDILVDTGGVLTQCAELVPGNPPGITLCHRSEGPYTVRWNGTEFTR